MTAFALLTLTSCGTISRSACEVHRELYCEPSDSDEACMLKPQLSDDELGALSTEHLQSESAARAWRLDNCISAEGLFGLFE